jgi:hypothetical protein
MPPRSVASRALTTVMLLGVVACHSRAAAPSAPRIVSRAEWGARDPVLPTREHVPVRITIHHTATNPDPSRPVGEKLRALQAWSQRDDSLAGGRRKPAWPDVPYHYYVAADGAVAEGREWRWVGDSNTPYDPTGHLLVVVEGNFERDTLATAQRAALNALVPALARRFRIPADSLRAHRDYARTACPGEHLYAELGALRALVRGSAGR